MVKHSASLFLIVLVSCNLKKQTSDIRIDKAINLKDAKLVIQVPKQMNVNNENCIDLFLNSKKYIIIGGYFNCNLDSIKVNTTGEIIGCSQKLYAVKDTVKICFAPTQIGGHQFPIVTLVFKDVNARYYAADTVFAFTVQ